LIRSLVILIASVVWCGVNGVRRALYGWGVFKARSLPLPVISVGNFEAGGTGKTPVVIAIAREAVARGMIPVVLTRGYGGAWGRSGVAGAQVICPGQSGVDPSLCGDEASLIQQQVPQAWIGVGPDRRLSFERVMEVARTKGQVAPRCAILDDGFQQLKIWRDLDILMMTSGRPWKKLFREWPLIGRASQALRVRSKGAQVAGADEFALSMELERPSESESVDRLWMVSGIGNPDAFEQSLQAAGWIVAARTDFRDHARFSAAWVFEALERAEERGLRIALTGKDWVKWQKLGVEPAQVRVFEPRLVFDPPVFLQKVMRALGAADA
jgi:tetraacyldisaccharide 4'-kinase